MRTFNPHDQKRLPLPGEGQKVKSRLRGALIMIGQGLFGVTLVTAGMFGPGLLWQSCSDEKPTPKAQYEPPPMTTQDKLEYVGQPVRLICLKHGIRDRAIQDKIGVFVWDHGYTAGNNDHADHLEAFAQNLGLPAEKVAAIIYDYKRLESE